MSGLTSAATGRSYGLARVCRAWGLGRATVYRQRQRDPAASRRRPGPPGPCDDATLLDHLRALIETSRFHGEGHRTLGARLRFAGIRTSMRRVRRLMRENQLLAPHRVGRPKTKAHEGTITTPAVDQMWGTDMTQTVTLRDGPAYVFVAVDHGNTECVGIHADRSGNRFQALEPIRQGVRHHFGAIAEGLAAGLQLRHDHGSNDMAHDFQDEIAFLGIASSPSFVREPEGNGVAERFIRTLKENLLWVRTFETIEELRQALIDFADWYNHHWLLARHGYQTPHQVRARQRQADLPMAA